MEEVSGAWRACARFGRALATLALAGLAAWGCRVVWLWVGPQGAWVRLYRGTQFQELGFVRPVDRAAFAFERGPGPRLPVDEFSARLSGWLYVAEDAPYRFASLSDGGNRVFVDGVLLIDGWRELSWRENGRGQGEARLQRGWHRLRVEYFNSSGPAKLRVEWEGGRVSPRSTIGGLSLWKYRLPLGG